MVAFVFVIVFIVLLVAASASLVKLFISGQVLTFDLATIVVPFLIWLGLSVVGTRPKSLSNLPEAVFLGVVVAAAITVRTFLFRSKPNAQRSIAAAVVCIVAAIVLYFAVPGLQD